MAGVVIAVLGVVAGGGWLFWLPEYRPAHEPGERYGIDVSGHQGHIDWARVAHDGITFAYVKATEGGDFVDRYFAENWGAAKTAGIERGGYHFFTLCTPGLTQAQNFLRTVPNDPAALPAAVDLELVGNCHARPDRASVLTQLNDYLETVEAVTHKPTVLYLGHDFESRYRVNVALHRPLWEFRFLRRPSNNWTIWQVDGFAHVAGGSGRVDLDVTEMTTSP